VTVDIAKVPRSEWSPLPFEGCVGVEGKVLVREEDFFIAMLCFPPHATIHEHPGENDTLVVCIQGEGFTSVAGETDQLHESERAFWPANVPHRLWTDDMTMTTLMVERWGVGFPARGLAEYKE
jgi:quercetin dioxygenase-like cupin family protein